MCYEGWKKSVYLSVANLIPSPPSAEDIEGFKN